MKILILGSQGNLGQDLVSVFSAAGHEVVGCDRCLREPGPAFR